MSDKVDFYKLPLGARFKYPSSDREYIKTDANVVVVPSDVYDDRTQEIYSAFSPEELDHTVEWIKPTKPKECPECGSRDYIQIDHEGDAVAPEATYWMCNDCGHMSAPE